MRWQIVSGRFLWIAGFIGFVVASCATITVNVYFPAKEVKEAVKSLREEFLQEPSPPPTKPEQPKPESQLPVEQKLIAEEEDARILVTRTSVVPIWALGRFKLSFLEALAQGDVLQELKKMPEVIEAYRRMGKRLPQITQLQSQGIVGEGNDGKLAIRDASKVTPAAQKIIVEENADREVVITGIAKAVAKLNKLEPTEANLAQFRPQASKQLAADNREAAKPGWWIQLPDGTWKKK